MPHSYVCATTNIWINNIYIYIYMNEQRYSYIYIMYKWLIWCDMTHSCEMHVFHTCETTHGRFKCVTGLMPHSYVCGTTHMTHSYVWHDSFVWDVSLSYVWNNTWPIHMCDRTHAPLVRVWHNTHDSFIRVTWLIRVGCKSFIRAKQHLTHSYVWHDSCPIQTCESTDDPHMNESYHMCVNFRTYDMTHS